MKKMVVYMLVIAILALTLVAATPMQRVGDRLVIPAGTGTLYYSENFPFYLAHGWYSEIGKPAQTTAIGGLRIEIDGATTPHDFIEFSRAEINGTEYLLKEFIFNFPDGMTGVHQFDLYYSNICSLWLARGDVTECDNPNEILEFLLRSWEVVFLEPMFVVYKPGAVEGYQWPLGHTITMDVNSGEYTAQSVSEPRPNFPEGETRVLFENWMDGYSIETGDYVVLTDETTGRTKEHLVTSVEVTGYDTVGNTISGVYDPAFGLEVFLAEYDNSFPINIYQPIEVTYDGINWTATFYDVEPDMEGAAKQSDSDFDGSSWDFVVPYP